MTRSWIVAGLSVCLALQPARCEGIWLEPDSFRPESGSVVALRVVADDDPSVLVHRRFQVVWRSGRENLESDRPQIRVADEHVRLFVLDASTRPDGVADRFAKALVVVGQAPAGDPLRWSETGQRLELVPQTDPVELIRGGRQLELQLLFDREPRARTLIEAQPLDGESAAGTRGRTDEIGLVRLDLDRPGPWRIRAAVPDGRRGRVVATLTLYVGPIR